MGASAGSGGSGGSSGPGGHDAGAQPDHCDGGAMDCPAPMLPPHAEPGTAACGDGIVQSGEECDPGPSDSPGCRACTVDGDSRCAGAPSLCGPSMLDWQVALEGLTRANLETYCTWITAASFGTDSSIDCPLGVTVDRPSVAQCADEFTAFVGSCSGILGDMLECLRGADACDIFSAGSARDAIRACQRSSCAGVCAPNTWSCAGNTARLCASDGLSYAQEVDCGVAVCVDGSDSATPIESVCDIDECAGTDQPCSANATCRNVPGSFACACNPGYAGDGISCADIDECAAGSDNCDANATCTNTEGSFACECTGDFTGSGTECLRDECALNLDNCDADASCFDTAQSFTCSCDAGYFGNGVTCDDVDECATGTHACDTNPPACSNVVGGYECSCPAGYDGDAVGGAGCTDLNECLDGTHSCDPNAHCTNVIGGFTCACATGYGGDGYTCAPYAVLTGLVPSHGVLGPTFDPQRTSYTLALPLAATSLSFTAEAGAEATILVNGQVTPTGTPSSATMPPVGTSTQTIEVSAAQALDRTYTISVARGAYTYFKPAYNTYCCGLFYGGPSYGESIATSGTNLVVGAPQTQSPFPGGGQGAGAVYFYERGASGWAQRSAFRPQSETTRQFGRKVAVDGNTAVVGELGAARVYVRSGSAWTEQAVLSRTDSRFKVNFAASMAISGDTIAIGDPGETSNATGIDGDETNDSLSQAGAVYVYTRVNETWSRQAYIKASNTDSSDSFGFAVALHGDTLIVAAPGEGSTATGINGDQNNNSDPGAGAVYVFVRSGATWTQQAYIKAMATNNSQRFGQVLTLSGDRFAATTQPSGLAEEPIVYIYERNGGVWSNGVVVRHPFATGVATSSYGNAMALRGDLLLIGQPGEGGTSALIDGSVNSDSRAVGAAYLFRRGPSGWQFLHYLKASNPTLNYEFGYSVAIDTWIAVGSPGDQSAATTINGSQANDLHDDSGAAYAF